MENCRSSNNKFRRGNLGFISQRDPFLFLILSFRVSVFGPLILLLLQTQDFLQPLAFAILNPPDDWIDYDQFQVFSPNQRYSSLISVPFIETLQYIVNIFLDRFRCYAVLNVVLFLFITASISFVYCFLHAFRDCVGIH